MSPNETLLSLLAAIAPDIAVGAGLAGTVLSLTGEFGPSGFGATTLEDHLVVFTHEEFGLVALLPEGLESIEAAVEQAIDYARLIGLAGFVVNPGTHQRFIPLNLIGIGVAPPVSLPPFEPAPNAEAEILAAVRASAKVSGVEKVWLARLPDGHRAILTDPHPDPAFEAGLMARDYRLPSYAATPWWPPIYP